MGRKKGRVPQQGATKQRTVAPGMLGILQARIGQQVTISFRADYIISEDGLMVRQGGMLIPDPSGAKDTFCLMSLMAPEPNEQGVVGRTPGAVGLISFTPDVVALVGTAVSPSQLPEIPEEARRYIQTPPGAGNGEGTIVTP